LAHADPIIVTPASLQELPLPPIGRTAEKDERGACLVIGGPRETPGAVLLAGIAAIRVGAGKLQLATDRSVAAGLAVAVPEAMVIAVDDAVDAVDGADAVLIGPGTAKPDGIAEVLHGVVTKLGRDTTLIIDAGALAALARDPDLIVDVRERTILMPNAAEMAVLLRRPVDEVNADLPRALDDAIERFGTTVTLRAPETWTSAPSRASYVDRAGGAGLGTSGSGDVLAGAITGLTARGADPLTAAVWANHVHAVAGDRCSARIGPIGFLARELLDEIPATMTSLG
jgi:hydroxyethylthiazole kinase-like uncharacterized protein yjeF